jgi:hypothetical protein
MEINDLLCNCLLVLHTWLQQLLVPLPLPNCNDWHATRWYTSAVAGVDTPRQAACRPVALLRSKVDARPARRVRHPHVSARCEQHPQAAVVAVLARDCEGGLPLDVLLVEQLRG